MPWCPECGVEYRDGFTECSDCRVALVAEQPQPVSVHEPEAEWVVVGVYTAAEDAELAVGFLRSEGMNAELAGSEVQPLPVEEHTAGEYLVEVPQPEAERAAALLADANEGKLALGEQDTPATADEGDGST